MNLAFRFCICLIWIICAIAFFTVRNSPKINGQTRQNTENKNSKPDNSLINSLDEAVQKRFLTEPYFGIRRIQPTYPTNPHLDYFSPNSEDERKIVEDFERQGWKVSFYLFGKRSKPRVVDGKEKKNFVINYRINQPVRITKNLQNKDIPKGELLMRNVKTSFLTFQNPGDENENSYEFRSGKWSYVARPVRAINETCLRCHTDYVVTEKLTSGKFKFRKRQIGDVNGVVVYGFKEDR